MRTVVRNSVARQSIRAERVRAHGTTCAECGSVRQGRRQHDPQDTTRVSVGASWLYRFHVDDDQGSRQSGPIAGGKLFCSRGCAEAYIGQPFAE